MAATMNIEIPADVLESARMTVQDAKLELAIALFCRGRLSMGKAAELAEMSVSQFQLQLGARQIGPHYSVEDALGDSAALAAYRRS
jgi:predicted HTH domain antitoxin